MELNPYQHRIRHWNYLPANWDYIFDVSFSSSGNKSRLSIYILHKIEANTDIFDTAAILEETTQNLRLSGDTEMSVGNIGFGVLDPEKYRAYLLLEIQKHVTDTTAGLADKYQVTLSGLESSVQVAQSGGLKVKIFINYRLTLQSVPGLL